MSIDNARNDVTSEGGVLWNISPERRQELIESIVRRDPEPPAPENDRIEWFPDRSIVSVEVPVTSEYWPIAEISASAYETYRRIADELDRRRAEIKERAKEDLSL